MRGVGWAQNLRSSEDGIVGRGTVFFEAFPKVLLLDKGSNTPKPDPLCGSGFGVRQAKLLSLSLLNLFMRLSGPQAYLWLWPSGASRT